MGFALAHLATTLQLAALDTIQGSGAASSAPIRGGHAGRRVQRWLRRTFSTWRYRPPPGAAGPGGLPRHLRRCRFVDWIAHGRYIRLLRISGPSRRTNRRMAILTWGGLRYYGKWRQHNRW